MSDKKSQTLPQLVLISGMAGSGYSTALNILEDVGFSAVDNLPLSLLDQLISLEVEVAGRQLAVSLDGRTSGFDPSGLVDLTQDVRQRLGAHVKLIFLSAQTDVLYRRFNATRRHHPLDQTGDLMAAIHQDSERMSPIESIADIAIDTSDASPSQFRDALLRQLGLLQQGKMPVLIQSFSYRHGIPQDADMTLDMRFIENPHWHHNLAVQTGLDKEVQDFIAKSKTFSQAMANLENLLKDALPRFDQEGRPKFTIATGCTGGRHRSVFTALSLEKIISKMGYEVSVTHRDL